MPVNPEYAEKITDLGKKVVASYQKSITELYDLTSLNVKKFVTLRVIKIASDSLEPYKQIVIKGVLEDMIRKVAEAAYTLRLIESGVSQNVIHV